VVSLLGNDAQEFNQDPKPLQSLAVGVVHVHPSALTFRFVKEVSGETAGPSTPFGTKYAPNFAQDDGVLF